MYVIKNTTFIVSLFNMTLKSGNGKIEECDREMREKRESQEDGSFFKECNSAFRIIG